MHFQGFPYEVGFEDVDGFLEILAAEIIHVFGFSAEHQIPGSDHMMPSHHGSPLDGIFEFPYVARPCIGQHGLDG